MPAKQRLRNVCFTLFSDDPYADFVRLRAVPEGLKCLVMQLEICPSNNRVHIQGYAEAVNALVFSSWRTLLGSATVHLSARNGTQKQAADYCQKEESRAPPQPDQGWDGEPFVFGAPGGEQGKRSDLEYVCEGLKYGKTVADMVEEHAPTIAKFHKGLAVVESMFALKKAIVR